MTATHRTGGRLRTPPRRPVVWLSALMLAVAAIIAACGLTRAPTASAAVCGGGERVVVVAPGDTLWAIALRHAPELDPRYGVYLLRTANDLRTAALSVGQRLCLPPGW